MGKYGYQCFKTKDRDVYCSSKEFKNHDEGAAWIALAMAHFNIQASDLLGKPYTADSQPDGATIWGPPNAADVHHYE